MNTDAELLTRICSAAEAVPVDPPAVDRTIRAGRTRGARRVIGLAAVLCVVGAGTVWAVTELGDLHGRGSDVPARRTFDPANTHPLRAPYGPEIPVPAAWSHRSSVVPDNQDLILSTNARAVHAAGGYGCAPTFDACVAKLVGEDALRRDDALIQVAIIDLPCDGCSPSPLPDPLGPKDFRQVGPIEDAPVMSVQRWVDDGKQINVGYWVGPDAGAATRAATEFLIANLRLPGPRFEPTDTHPVKVPYSNAPVPVPNGWASASAEGLHFALGLAASTNADAVRDLVDGCTSELSSCSIKPIRTGQLHRDDAFVEVQISYCCPAHGDPLPPRIRSRDFPAVGQLLGADLYRLSGMAIDGGLYIITFWEGPDATGATQEALPFLVEALNLPRAAPPLPGREYQDPDHHFTIEIPDGWERAGEPLTPPVPSLVEIFSAGTYPLRPGSGSCDPFPVNAVDDLGPEDSFVWVAEAPPATGFPPRPDTFAGHEATQHVGAQFCLPISARPFRQWIFPFTQGGRSFYLYVGMGDGIAAARRAEAWRLADSFDPEPAPFISPMPAPTGTTSTTSSGGR